jgi:uncharacterized membrane-anchored protein
MVVAFKYKLEMYYLLLNQNCGVVRRIVMKKIVILYALVLFFCAVGSASAVSLPPDYNTVPEPSTLLMIGSGIVGMLAFCRRKK